MRLRPIYLWLVTVLLAAGCMKTETRTTIAVVPRLDDATMIQARRAAIAKGEELGIHVRWDVSRSATSTSQAVVIDQLIKAGIRGILISCLEADDPEFTEAVQRARDAGIVVATFDSDSPASSRIFHIGTDNVAAGALCARTLAELCAEAGREAVEVGIFAGMEAGQNMQDRLTGFYSVIPVRDTAGVFFSEEISATGQQQITELLSREEAVNGVAFFNSTSILNGPQGNARLDSLCAVGGAAVFFDPTIEIFRFMTEQPFCAAIQQDYAQMTAEGVELLVRAMRGESVPEYTYTQIAVIDRDEAGNQIETMGQ